MAGNLKRIEQTAKVLLAELLDLGNQFNDAYDRYLHALASGVQRQLILATYQICTQGYPDRFLALSVTNRASVQAQMRALARQLGQELVSYFETDDLEGAETTETAKGETGEAATPSDLNHEENQTGDDRSADKASTASEGTQEPSDLANVSVWRIEDLTAEKLKQMILASQSVSETDADADEEEAEDGNETDKAEKINGINRTSGADVPPGLSEHEAQLIALALQAKLRSEAEADDDDTATPNNLRAWQRSIERDILRLLHDASMQANQLLHQCHILPQEFPLGLIDTFEQDNMMVESSAKTPNLLRLTIKAGSADEDGEITSDTLQLMAIHLRLSEIEFAEAAVGQARHQIRQLVAKLSHLRQRYSVNQREYAIAQAEAAWRSTWCEDSY